MESEFFRQFIEQFNFYNDEAVAFLASPIFNWTVAIHLEGTWEAAC